MENDRNMPAAKGDIDDLRQEMCEMGAGTREELRQMNGLHEILRSEMGNHFSALTETVRAGQAELLKAFRS